MAVVCIVSHVSIVTSTAHRGDIWHNLTRPLLVHSCSLVCSSLAFRHMTPTHLDLLTSYVASVFYGVLRCSAVFYGGGVQDGM